MQISLLRRKFVLIRILFCRQSLDLYYDQGTLYEWLIVYYCKLMKSYDESNYRVQLTFNDLKKINGPRKFVKLILNWPFFFNWAELAQSLSSGLYHNYVLFLYSLRFKMCWITCVDPRIYCWRRKFLAKLLEPSKTLVEATFCYGRVWLYDILNYNRGLRQAVWCSMLSIKLRKLWITDSPKVRRLKGKRIAMGWKKKRRTKERPFIIIIESSILQFSSSLETCFL
jgi:hypothetical protein